MLDSSPFARRCRAVIAMESHKAHMQAPTHAARSELRQIAGQNGVAVAVHQSRNIAIEVNVAEEYEPPPGPIPLSWLSSAAQLPGKSLHVAVALWFLRGLQDTPVVTLSNVMSERFGLDRNAKYRGLGWLEEAGLVSVSRKCGRSPMVTIRDAEGLHDE